MVPSILLIHRHEWHGHEWPGGQVTRIEPLQVEQWALSRSELAGFCGCPLAALRCSRVGPVHLAHGGAWARLEALDSLRWPLLEAPVIHGPAVAVRQVVGSGGLNRSGDAPAWRALEPWEAENALGVLRRHALPLEPASCPVDQALERVLGWPLAGEFLRAQQAGDGAAVLRIRLQVQRQRREWAQARGSGVC
jgi:hypothetical protein